MNTNSTTLPISAFLATLAAIALLPVSAAEAGLTLTATGILALLCGDYGRSIDKVTTASPVVPFSSLACDPLAEAA
jgi:hypothetical protein